MLKDIAPIYLKVNALPLELNMHNTVGTSNHGYGTRHNRQSKYWNILSPKSPTYERNQNLHTHTSPSFACSITIQMGALEHTPMSLIMFGWSN